MANWIPEYYALTGSKEELLDIESKINQVEQTAREKQKAEGSDWTGCEIEHFARLIGSELTYADLGGYWNYDSNALEWKQTEDGEEYLLWNFTNKHWENPRMREMIEGHIRLSRYSMKLLPATQTTKRNAISCHALKW